MIQDKEIEKAVKTYILKALNGTNPDYKVELVPEFVRLLDSNFQKTFCDSLTAVIDLCESNSVDCKDLRNKRDELENKIGYSL